MKLFSVVALIVSIPLAVQAQTVEKLTLEKSVQLALEKNVTVIQARNNIEGAQSSVRAAYGGLLPTVRADGNYATHTNWVNPLPSATSQDFNAGVNANLVIFDGLANTSTIRYSEASEAATEYTYTRAQQSAVVQTHLLFLDIVRTSQLLKVAEDNLKRSKRQLERITESNKVGAVALADVYRQQVQVGSDEVSLIQAQIAFEKAKQDIIAFLGVDFDREYQFDFAAIPSDIDTSEFSVINAQYANFAVLESLAIDKRPDYQASMQNVRSADASLSIARAGHYPTLSANASYGWSGSDDPIAGFSPLSDNRAFRAGLVVSLPIFTGFATQERVDQASVAQRNQNERHGQARRDMILDIRKALLDLEAAEKAVVVTKSSVESAILDQKIAEEKYNLGANTLLDLLVATAAYSTAQGNKVNATVGYLYAKKKMEYALGIITQ